MKFEVSTALVLRTPVFWIVTLKGIYHQHHHHKVLMIPTFCDSSSHLLSITSQKAKSSQNWTYYCITTYHFIYLELIWYESHICSKSRWCQTCWQCKLTSFAGSDVKWVKQSFHLFKLEEPLSCGGTQRRKLWSRSRSFLCSWVMVSILHLCKH